MEQVEEITANEKLTECLKDHVVILRSLPHSKERSLAIIKLQESIFWIKADVERLTQPETDPSTQDPITGEFLVAETIVKPLSMPKPATGQ